MSHADIVAEYYDANTEPFYLRRWDREDIHFGLFDGYERTLSGALKAMTHAIVAPARISAADTVLDAGCGVGGAALDLNRDIGCHVVGVTISSRQVDLARERAAAAGITRLEFLQADCARHLPLPDASVDVVMTIEAACHFDDKKRFLEECRRVLRPDGQIVGSDWIRVPALRLASIQSEAVLRVERAWRLANLYSMAEWLDVLHDIGFEIIATQDFGELVKPNAELLLRAQRELLLEAAAHRGARQRTQLWLEQYESLWQAWNDNLFSIGRFHARARA